jgi:capsular polysaccharide biosynthesis protein
MSQQALDLRRSIKITRRHRKTFGAIVILGLLAGAAYAVLKPPAFTSSALVVLPAAAAANAQAAASGTANSSGSDTYIATQVVIADSDSVLANALPDVGAPVSLQTLQGEVQVKSLTGSILSITATGATAGRAAATANAVANSYIAYVTSASSPVGHVSARVLEPAVNATGGKKPERIVLFGLLGALAGVLAGYIVSLAIGRNDRRLRERDEIANSIGAPVLASIPVSRPSDAASWAKLLAEYDPGVVNGWALSKMLQQFGVGDKNESALSLTVLSLSGDRGALALGPQIAAYTASRGISTALVIGPRQDVNTTATLRTACTAPLEPARQRPKPLELIVCDDGHLGRVAAAFVVVVEVVDDEAPLVPDTIRTTATVLGVSAGAATAEQLARAATAAAGEGRDIFGILVANPYPDDQTTGRIPRLAPPARRSVPTRVDDVQTRISR